MKNNTKYLAINGLLVALAIAVQITGRAIPAVSQGFVGPFINAILIIGLLSTNLKYACMVAVITPITAFLTGQLNPAMAFFVPFICLGNIIYVVLFSVLKSYGKEIVANVIKLGVASLGKYLFLSLSASKIVLLLNLGIAPQVLDKLAIAMGLPQLYTAITGGIIAIVIYALVKSKIMVKEFN